MNSKPNPSLEDLEQAFSELSVHFDKCTSHLEHALKLAAKQGQQYGQALEWLRDIRQAAGATAPGISHQELCMIIRDLRRRAFENELNRMHEETQ